MSKNVLIIVDIQRDFCPRGSLACPRGNEIIKTINKLTQEAQWEFVVATQDWHPEGHCSFASSHEGADPFTIPDDGYADTVWPDHCISGTWGAKLNSRLNQSKIGIVVRKGMDKDVDSYSAFKDNNGSNPSILNKFFTMDELHSGSKFNLFICGIATEVCVKNTALDAITDSVTVHIISDACAGVTEEGHEAALVEMEKRGIKIITSDEILAR